MAPSIDPAFGVELLKLLLQVAYADNALHPSETKMIMQLAKYWALPQDQVDEIAQVMQAPAKLPAPNLAVLKKSPHHVLEGLRFVARADGGTSAEESDLIDEVETLLGIKLA